MKSINLWRLQPNGHQPLTVVHHRARTTCPHCINLRRELRCWKWGATILVIFLLVLLTLVKV